MNVQLKASVVIATIILAIQACAPSESLQVMSSRDALPEDCEVMVYSPGQDKPENYDLLATIKFGDTGLSVSCGEETIREAMRAEACKIGANSIIITWEASPSLAVTCYRVVAELVHIEK